MPPFPPIKDDETEFIIFAIAYVIREDNRTQSIIFMAVHHCISVCVDDKMHHVISMDTENSEMSSAQMTGWRFSSLPRVNFFPIYEKNPYDYLAYTIKSQRGLDDSLVGPSYLVFGTPECTHRSTIAQ